MKIYTDQRKNYKKVNKNMITWVILMYQLIVINLKKIRKKNLKFVKKDKIENIKKLKFMKKLIYKTLYKQNLQK